MTTTGVGGGGGRRRHRHRRRRRRDSDAEEVLQESVQSLVRALLPRGELLHHPERGVSTERSYTAPRPTRPVVRRADVDVAALEIERRRVGGGIGAIATFIATSLYPVDPAVGFGALFGYFALFGVTGGVLLGALVAILLDRVSTRRARSVDVHGPALR